jgi:hypothetical protein
VSHRTWLLLDAQARHLAAAAAFHQLTMRRGILVHVAHGQQDALLAEKTEHARTVRTTRELVQSVGFHGGALCSALRWQLKGYRLDSEVTCAEESEHDPQRRDRVRRPLVVALVGYGSTTRGIRTTDTFVEVSTTTCSTASAERHAAMILVREYFPTTAFMQKLRFPGRSVARDHSRRCVFERSPVAFSPAWEIVGQSYYALAATGALSENHRDLPRDP